MANVATRFVAGSGEGLVAAETVGMTAAKYGFPRLAAAAFAGARAPGPALVGGFVGAPLGLLAEGAASNAGLGETASVAAGVSAATIAGAIAGGAAAIALGAVASPVILGAAIVGGLAAGFGYLVSRALR